MVYASYEAPSPESGTGGTGGFPFDTGRNIAGVRKVKVWTAYGGGFVQGIALEFNDDASTSKHVASTSAVLQEFLVPSGEEIIKVLVWGDKARVQAIQFLADGGTVSPRFGVGWAITPIEYSGKTGEECLAGMYGAFSRLDGCDDRTLQSLRRVGFSFHKIGYLRAVEVSEARMDQVSVEAEPINCG